MIRVSRNGLQGIIKRIDPGHVIYGKISHNNKLLTNILMQIGDVNFNILNILV